MEKLLAEAIISRSNLSQSGNEIQNLVGQTSLKQLLAVLKLALNSTTHTPKLGMLTSAGTAFTYTAAENKVSDAKAARIVFMFHYFN